MIVDVTLGKLMRGSIDSLRRMEFGSRSQISIPIAVLIWFMIIPMMTKVDFAAIRNVSNGREGFCPLFRHLVDKADSTALVAWGGRFVFSF
jgi:arsenite transporter